MELTVEELANVVMGELSYINFGLLMLTLVLIAIVALGIWKFKELNEHIAKLEAKQRKIQRELNRTR